MLLDDLFSNEVEAIVLPTTQPDQEWFSPDPAIRLAARQVARELDCDEITSLRLTMLGRSAQEITDYLHPAPQHIHHPDATVAGMTDAAHQLMQGIARGERVAVYADYDVDGQTSLAILSSTLRAYQAQLVQGSATATTGFGLTRDFVERAIAEGAQWLITVDCGSTQSDPIRLAQQAGLRCIVIDHHDVELDNPADFHLNPRLAAVRALTELLARMSEIGCRQRLQVASPYTAVVDRLTERSVGLLTTAFGERYDLLVSTIRNGSNPTNTGSMLTWKFAAAIHMTQVGRVPNHHYGRSLYLAGLGAIADLAPCDDQEVRAFVRVGSDTARQLSVFGNVDVIPPGIGLLADALGEEPARPDCLVRTRALLNLPKRTSEIAVTQIQRLLTSDEIPALLPLVERLMHQYQRLSTIRRMEMDPEALRQVRETNERGEGGYFAYAVLDGYEAYAGYTRMVANTLVKDTGCPAICFAHKGSDEWGQELYKFSGANGVVPDAKLGELIADPSMRAACTVLGRDWLDNEAQLVCVGGHLEVVSGVCTREQIPFVQAAAEAWAAQRDQRRRWRPIEHKRPRVAKRRVTARWFARLETEAGLLAPLAFPGNPAVQVSVVGTFNDVIYDPEAESWLANLHIEDLVRPVRLSDQVANLARNFPGQRWEAVLALGRPDRYWIGCLACA